MKCGSDLGWEGPRFRRFYAAGDAFTPEWSCENLEYVCRACGYERREPTNDAKPPEPPEFVRLLDGIEVTDLRGTTRPAPARWWQFWR